MIILHTACYCFPQELRIVLSGNLVISFNGGSHTARFDFRFVTRLLPVDYVFNPFTLIFEEKKGGLK